ncbi:MAG: hypothetical protein GW795_05970 [Cyanobacteria bacterium]|nr:hypothetical protein [Cyanobacteria bacterium CG_2015-16_32_12]NCO78678.1 hypothetical protein [Cyanobacteria bacterium CG_2015-22_32_23]NCQ05451.1 hypothetical protein [Cyanobacteria bacterium CG_2015-09_32_10]NCQ41433.1 hypothetical protein [Cyanobacteria bacterium CG_2015-04_32_10]NCS85737.1 hypothetical protein [Cyanobacteria bacterium CG_2015-02_32_10]
MDLSFHHLMDYSFFFAQVIKDPDIIGQITDAWNNFIESGQVWAMLTGVFFGYVFANFTRF